jgi:hypothetical protein
MYAADTMNIYNEPALHDWSDLAEAAPRELACPLEALRLDVVPHYRSPSTFLAEGCGARAQFVRNLDEALVMTSRVAFAPAAAPPAPAPAPAPPAPVATAPAAP